MSKNRNLVLGLFFAAVVGLLGYFTIFMTDFTLFGEKTLRTVLFSNTNGLRQGDSVLIAGVRWGKVEGLTFYPDRQRSNRIEVRISLDQPIDLHEDYSIRIKDATLLGGKHLEIDPGLPDVPVVPEDQVLIGVVSKNVLDAVNEWVADNRQSMTNIVQNVEALVTDARTGQGVVGRLISDEGLGERLDTAVSSVAATFENFEDLTGKLTSGQGTFGRLFTDEQLSTRVSDIVGNVDALVKDVREGKGVVGRLLVDEQSGEDLSQTLSSLRSVSESLANGEGTLGRLINDATLMNDIEKVVAGLAAGEGTLGRLLTEDDVYNDVRTIAADLAATTGAIRNGEGTLGRLIYDDDVYRGLSSAVDTLRGSLEEAREAAPISTFLNTLFLGF